MGIITTQNSKLGGMIAQVNMPYLKTCREDAPCKSGCYCAKGNLNYPSVRKSHMDKYKLYKSNPEAFFNMISAELDMVPYRFFRWHSSGDIPDIKYLGLMCKLARKHKGTRFLCYTKKWEMVNVYFDSHRKPSNLVIVLSNWGNWRVVNPHNFPESFVDFGNGDVPDMAYRCGGSCAECPGTHCWFMHYGDLVVFEKH